MDDLTQIRVLLLADGRVMKPEGSVELGEGRGRGRFSVGSGAVARRWLSCAPSWRA